jgi:HK97 family phage prohead protease
MPSSIEHSARINEPSKYEKIRRKNDEFGTGIHVIYGVLKNDNTEVQAIHFDKTKFTAAEAKKWLSEHDYKPIEFVAATEKSNIVEIEYKSFSFKSDSFEESKGNDGNFGIIKGYASTFGNIDLGGDIVERGAFVKCLEKYAREGKNIPMYFQHSHMDIIGGFDPRKTYEDEKGLYFGEGKINLDVTRGRDVYALAKQKVLCEMSIGYMVNDAEFEPSEDGYINRRLKEVDVKEISVVANPMNPLARMTDVKNKLKNIENEEVGTLEMVTLQDIQAICNKSHLPNDEKAYLLRRLLHDQGSISKSASKFISERFFDDENNHFAKVNEKIEEKIEEKKEEIAVDQEKVNEKNDSNVENELKNLLLACKEGLNNDKIVEELAKLRKAVSN